jgi:hypothetical protein
MENSLESWVHDLELGKEQGHKNLTYIPITSSQDHGFDFLTLDESLKHKLVDVTELEEGASVPELKVINRSEKYLLIFDGEHLIGAKQNRIVNKTIIVKPKSEIVIPVSCTEQGRWRYESRVFSRSKYGAPSSIRKKLKQKLYSQHEVWDDIAHKISSFAVHSATSSLEDVYGEIDSSFEDYREKISKVPSQVGFIAFINDEFAGLDIVGDPELFSAMHESLINSYLMDAMYSRKERKKKVDPKKQATGILDEVIKASTKEGTKIGVEKREELKGKKTVGEFVRFDGKPVHLAVFPTSEMRKQI